MKKIILLALPILALLIMLPQGGQAMKVKKFKHFYLGSWENTWDSCGGTGETGSIEIKLTKIKKTGKITKAKVWFNDGRIGDMTARGKVYWDNGVRKIRLRYTEYDWADDYLILGSITKDAIVGTYDHSYGGCQWGGTIDLIKE